ncbi:HTH-type transcriptional activator AllS [Raoultella terrigena]|uniref:HTH-type transcriptional activator AllS n=1 Tax=Raoultella terrigena TaxID=577 RepID=A0A4U9D6N8_RAOTE|nr:HTH-type transcriptional activator AllS [Raoultella terrigena]
MRYSPEALTAFVEAVACGSFSAAARRLRKSQSTVSTAISNLEADLGVTLFDRSARQPVLTPQGEQVLSYVKAILAASDRLDELAISLSGETEPGSRLCSPIRCIPMSLKICWSSSDRRFPPHRI